MVIFRVIVEHISRRTLPFAIAPIPILELTSLASPKTFPLSFQALTGTHFATPLFSISCRNGGCTPGHSDAKSASRMGLRDTSTLICKFCIPHGLAGRSYSQVLYQQHLWTSSASAANKRLTLQPDLSSSPVDVTHTKKQGGGVLASASREIRWVCRACLVVPSGGGWLRRGQ
jgi:hypothetical protein